MPLEEYRKKRNFAETSEPVGRIRRGRRTQLFVVQKHDASHLHYDFRLEIGGVLASWAVPKGPSMNPSEKRLAIRTEDHPLEYAEFEGVIPEGEYGAGTVMVWDEGNYQSKDGQPPDTQLARRRIDIVLQGQRLLGGFALVRTGLRGRQEQWLLIKERDAYAAPSWDIENTKFGRSVLTGRKLKEIAEGKPAKKVRVERARI